MKTTSRFAVAAAAGLFVGGIALTPAQAADLGGDCCADLEERVAELEATTVRKGNRKVSLKLSGQVNKALLIWDDGEEFDAYVVDNINSSSRFRLTGSAKFKPGWSAGYFLEVELTSARSISADQVDNQRGALNQSTIRHSVWYMKSDKLGTVWLGQYSPATDDLQFVSLGGNGVASSTDVSLIGGGMQLRLAGVAGNAGLTGQRWGTVGVPSFDTARSDIVRYDSPDIWGCVFSSAWGENDLWDVAIRCKKELNSVKVLFAAGYVEFLNEDTLGVTTVNERTGRNDLIFSGSIIHDPTGLFVTGNYARREFDNTHTDNGCVFNAANPTGCGDVDKWSVQVGVFKRFNDLGKTSIWVDYTGFDDAGVGLSGAGFAGNNAVIISSETNVWGGGIVQFVDNAALELYLDYKHLEYDATTSNAAGTAVTIQNIDDLDMVIAGARMKF